MKCPEVSESWTGALKGKPGPSAWALRDGTAQALGWMAAQTGSVASIKVTKVQSPFRDNTRSQGCCRSRERAHLGMEHSILETPAWNEQACSAKWNWGSSSQLPTCHHPATRAVPTASAVPTGHQAPQVSTQGLGCNGQGQERAGPLQGPRG